MSGSIGAAAGWPFTLIVADSQAAATQLDTLTEQAASGHVADTFGGLDAAASVSLSLSPQIALNQTLQNAIGQATGQMQVAQTALSSISSIASTFFADTDQLTSADGNEVDSVAAAARDALSQVADLLDTQDGGTYVFAGQDGGNPPVPDPDGIADSGFATQIAAAIGNLGSSGGAAVIAGTYAIAASNAAGTSPFSAALSQPASALAGLRASVPVGDGQSVPTGILASANGDVASTGGATSGSYMRDILRGLATLASLSSSQTGTAGFADVVADVRTSLGGAVTALNEDAGVMGNRQTQLTATQTALGDTATALTQQVSNVDDVDMAATLSALSSAQTKLQASYQLISTAHSLSLATFLTST